MPRVQGTLIPRRLAFEETVSRDRKPFHIGDTVVEFHDFGGRTALPIASRGGESWRTGEGWTPARESLACRLESP
jgi:hypothetical protein